MHAVSTANPSCSPDIGVGCIGVGCIGEGCVGVGVGCIGVGRTARRARTHGRSSLLPCAIHVVEFSLASGGMVKALVPVRPVAELVLRMVEFSAAMIAPHSIALFIPAASIGPTLRALPKPLASILLLRVSRRLWPSRVIWRRSQRLLAWVTWRSEPTWRRRNIYHLNPTRVHWR